MATKRDIASYYGPLIRDIFNNKKWPLGLSLKKETHYENFCNLFSQLDDSSCEMMLQLMKEFLWVKNEEYDDLMYDLFERLNDIYRGKEGCLYICPLKASKNNSTFKSCDDLFYRMAAAGDDLRDEFPLLSFDFIDNCNSSKLKKLSNNDEVILIDDFIGTGKSALDAKMAYVASGVHPDKIHFYCFVCLEIGYDKISENGNDVFCLCKMPKGISDRKDGKESLYSKLMTKIEFDIAVPKSCQFGYGHSEALVKVMNTPNNTFPIFWMRSEKNPYAPFPRRTKK